MKATSSEGILMGAKEQIIHERSRHSRIRHDIKRMETTDKKRKRIARFIVLCLSLREEKSGKNKMEPVV